MLAGAAICEFAPASPEEAADDIPTVLRLLSALTSGTAKHGRAARLLQSRAAWPNHARSPAPS